MKDFMSMYSANLIPAAGLVLFGWIGFVIGMVILLAIRLAAE